MAYNPSGLSVASYVNSFTLWHYRTDDPAWKVERNHFNPARNQLRLRDLVIVDSTHVSSPLPVIMAVTDVDPSSGGVTLTPITRDNP